MFQIDPAKYKSITSGFGILAKEALCPFEAVKVRVQTQPGFARGLSDGLPKFIKSEGALGLVFHLIFFKFALIYACCSVL